MFWYPVISFCATGTTPPNGAPVSWVDESNTHTSLRLGRRCMSFVLICIRCRIQFVVGLNGNTLVDVVVGGSLQGIFSVGPICYILFLPR
jgi:hypothetical protein